jgi:hypothetical protein
VRNSWFDWTVRTTVPLLRVLRSGQLRPPVTPAYNLHRMNSLFFPSKEQAGKFNPEKTITRCTSLDIDVES